MSFPSCIKIPVSKDETPSTDKDMVIQEQGITPYNELLSVANEVFGSGKWSHAVTSQTVDFVEYVMGKYHIGCAAFVRVQLPDGTFHEEMGYNNAESSAKGSAIHSARVSSITNALKKALLCFGGIMADKINAIPLNNGKRKLELNADEMPNEKCIKSDTVKLSRSNSASRRSKSPNEIESSTHPTNNETVKKDVMDCKVSSNNPSTLQIQKPSSSKTTENSRSEEIRLEEMLRAERKRKQREKQEEYRRLMLKEESKNAEKSNAKF